LKGESRRVEVLLVSGTLTCFTTLPLLSARCRTANPDKIDLLRCRAYNTRLEAKL
jgi:hypothetical protein